MIPGDVSHGFTDTRECRAVVPPFYSEYAFTKPSQAMRGFEGDHALQAFIWHVIPNAKLLRGS